MSLTAADDQALRDELARGWPRWGQATSRVDHVRSLVDAVTPADCYADETDLTVYAGRDGRNLADRIAALKAGRT